jgi:hypothetical protein
VLKTPATAMELPKVTRDKRISSHLVSGGGGMGANWVSKSLSAGSRDDAATLNRASE